MVLDLKRYIIRSDAKNPKHVSIHGRRTSIQWLCDVLLKWFGPFDTRVDTGLPCVVQGCKGRLQHVYEVVEIDGVVHKVVFTKTHGKRRVSAKVYDSCSLPSCPDYGDWVLAGIENDKALAKAYKKQTRAWKYR